MTILTLINTPRSIFYFLDLSSISSRLKVLFQEYTLLLRISLILREKHIYLILSIRVLSSTLENILYSDLILSPTLVNILRVFPTPGGWS